MLKSELTRVYSERTAKDFFLLIAVVIVFAVIIVTLILWYRPTPERPALTGAAQPSASERSARKLLALRSHARRLTRPGQTKDARQDRR